MKDNEEKINEIKEKLEDLFVNRYDTFKESVKLINDALRAFDINYEFTYNDFCSTFSEKCFEYMRINSDIDITDPKQMMVHTLPIIISVIEDVKNKHGFKNDQSDSKNIVQ